MERRARSREHGARSEERRAKSEEHGGKALVRILSLNFCFCSPRPASGRGVGGEGFGPFQG